MNARLVAKDISIPHRLEPCDLTFDAGSVTMLVGPNGAGKTSLLHALACLPGSSGQVHIDGDNLAKLPSSQRIQRLAFLGASRDVRWPLIARSYIALGLPEQSHKGRIDAVLQALEAESLAEHRLDHLSTGERSRIMIARALVPQADLLLFDEPCANLDPQWQLAILAQLRSEAARGATVILSIHDLDLARQFGDRVIVIDKSRMVADGVPAETLSVQLLSDIFGVARHAEHWVRVK